MKSDFLKAFSLNGLDIKSIDRIFSKFEKVLPGWIEFINLSFIPDKMKTEFIDLIYCRAKRLEII